MESKIKNFRDLEVWRLGKEIVLGIYEITKTLQKEEVYGLAAQMRRAAVSIPSNVAEALIVGITKSTGNFCISHWDHVLSWRLK